MGPSMDRETGFEIPVYEPGPTPFHPMKPHPGSSAAEIVRTLPARCHPGPKETLPPREEFVVTPT